MLKCWVSHFKLDFRWRQMELVRMWPVWSICEFQASQDYITTHQLKNKQTNTETHQNLGSRYGGWTPVTPTGEMESGLSSAVQSTWSQLGYTLTHPNTHSHTPNLGLSTLTCTNPGSVLSIKKKPQAQLSVSRRLRQKGNKFKPRLAFTQIIQFRFFTLSQFCMA